MFLEPPPPVYIQPTVLLSPLKPQLLTLGCAPSLSLQFHTSSSLQEVATTTVTYCTNPFSIALAGTVTSTVTRPGIAPPTHPPPPPELDLS